MTEKKLFAVLGASGVQGSGVIHAVLSHPTLSQQFNIRALSRNPGTIREKYGSSSGIDFAAADVDSVTSLKEAFAGAHTVFGLTNYYETRSLQRDVQQGKNIADAAAACGVKHLIWSSMRFAAEVSEGEIVDAPGLDGKAEVSNYIEEIKGGADLKTTHLLVGFYLSNLPRIFGYENDGGAFECKLPWNREETRMPLVDAAVDVGRFVAGVMVKGPEVMDGKWVQTVSQWITMGEICQEWKEMCNGREGMRGREMRYEEVSKSVFEERLPEPLRVEQLGNLVVIIDKYQLFGKGTIEKQVKDDNIVEEAGLKKSSWVEYLMRDFDKDFADPMFPPFMVPYLQHRLQANGVKEAHQDEAEVLANGDGLGVGG